MKLIEQKKDERWSEMKHNDRNFVYFKQRFEQYIRITVNKFHMYYITQKMSKTNDMIILKPLFDD